MFFPACNKYQDTDEEPNQYLQELHLQLQRYQIGLLTFSDTEKNMSHLTLATRTEVVDIIFAFPFAINFPHKDIRICKFYSNDFCDIKFSLCSCSNNFLIS